MEPNLNNITKMYDKLTYYDQYGGSLILFIIITIIVMLLISYFHTMMNIQPIVDDWANQRCKPTIIPFAGFITHPNGVSATEYTAQNFAYCTQTILSNITGHTLQPLTFLTNALQHLATNIQNSIQSSRAMFDKVRSSMQNVSEDIMGRLLNITIPLMQIVISFKDLIAKIQGSMTAGLFTLLGSYYSLKSLMGAIAQIIIRILIALSVMIAAFWAVPFTWGAAAANTAIFVAISIPLAIILSFMSKTLKISDSYKIPKVKCFDKNTLIKMNDGLYKKIIEIKPGEKLANNNLVTAKIKVSTEGSIMYFLNNVLVSDSHIVQYNNKWIPVSKHPCAVKTTNYNEPYLYCLNTSQKIIEINNSIFTDWDEIYSDRLESILQKTNLPKHKLHSYLDCGFSGTSKIPLKTRRSTALKNININDILENGEKVYGIVEIDGQTIVQQYSYNLGENIFLEGHSSDFRFSKKIISPKHTILYHLLTNKGTFKIENITINDYNDAIDRL